MLFSTNADTKKAHFAGNSTKVMAKTEYEEKREVAGVTGLEPAASGVTGRRSNQLSYTPKKRFAYSRLR